MMSQVMISQREDNKQLKLDHKLEYLDLTLVKLVLKLELHHSIQSNFLNNMLVLDLKQA